VKLYIIPTNIVLKKYIKKSVIPLNKFLYNHLLPV